MRSMPGLSSALSAPGRRSSTSVTGPAQKSAPPQRGAQRGCLTGEEAVQQSRGQVVRASIAWHILPQAQMPHFDRRSHSAHLRVCHADCERHCRVPALYVVEALREHVSKCCGRQAAGTTHTLMPAALVAEAARPYSVSVGTATACNKHQRSWQSSKSALSSPSRPSKLRLRHPHCSRRRGAVTYYCVSGWRGRRL